MRTFLRLALSFTFIINTLSATLVQAKTYVVGSHVYEYNPGPDPKTEMGRRFIDIFADQPFYGYFSEELMEDQKFRYIFGLMMTRTYFTPNSVKIFFIGQDATHIAEAAKQPGTSGFGGRVQDIANYFGVDQGVATSNAFLSTIKGQFGAFDHIVKKVGDDGKAYLTAGKYIDNELWMIANGEDSEIRIQREKFWEAQIENNPESMKMMAMFGDAAKHAFAQFLIARGAEVPNKMSDEELKRTEVPETKLVNAGGNAEFAVPVTKDGKDIYQILENEDAKANDRKPKRLDYSATGADKKTMVDQLYAINLAKKLEVRAMELMIFTKGGKFGSGMMSAAQMGGPDLTKVKINGQITNSLKGLKLLYSKKKVIEHDIAFAESPHPTALSQMTPDKAIAALKRAFEPLKVLRDKFGWKIEPDIDVDGKLRINSFHDNKDPNYGRADIRQGFFEFGAPNDRRASSADAIRLNPQAIIIGSRQKLDFDRQKLKNMESAKPSQYPNEEDLWSVRPRNLDQRYDFDTGPGEDVAKAMLEALENSREKIFALKEGFELKKDKRGNDVTFDFYGINAYYSKSVPSTGFFGLHRGDFKTSKVLILADPHGIDDWNTARALTGARGQYLNGLMNDLGIGKDYLVIKTAPLQMDNASAEDWEHVRKHTEGYREAALKEALKNKNLEFVMADGPVAQAEMKRILKKLKRTNLSVIDINRDGMDPKSGILEAGEAVKVADKSYQKARISAVMKDIPRGHLPWWARCWEGTSGDLVLDASGKGSGKVKVVVTPDWVVEQKVKISEREKSSLSKLRKVMEDAGLKMGSETFDSFFERVARMKKGIKEKVGTMIEMMRGKIAEKAAAAAPVISISNTQCIKIYGKTAQ